MTTEALQSRINELRKQKNAIILAHNYQIPEVQDIADYIGDSLGLARKAAQTDAETIVFCGVHFMAETASVICPQKKVLIPDMEAGCSLADTITAEQLRAWKAEHPGAVVVMYVNTTAEVKAETDYCCTSSNAMEVINAISKDKEILFGPDKFLGSYIQLMTGRENMHIWEGACHVHEKIGDLNLGEKQKEHPEAEILIHPECGCSTSCMLNSAFYHDCKDAHIYSTGGMIDFVKESEAKEFVVATETGILHRMKKENPGKDFIPANEESVCEFMKKINLHNLYEALEYDQYEVKVPEELAKRAIRPIERMLAIG